MLDTQLTTAVDNGVDRRPGEPRPEKKIQVVIQSTLSKTHTIGTGTICLS